MMAEYIDLTKDDGIDLHIISSEESNKYVVIHFTDRNASPYIGLVF